ncbi:hypothetical protein APHAL10511_001803 [Amanita phalloides]|nr:hypothetical protein APHAL10511_001803 [Amanita phalloides]
MHKHGRVLYDVFLYTNKDDAGQHGYLIEYDSRPSEAPALFPMLKKYVLRSKVKIRDVTDQYDVWAGWGSPQNDTLVREWQWASSGAVEPVWNNLETEWPWGTEDCALLDRRAVGLGSRFLVRKGDRPPRASTHDIKTLDDYTLHRVSLGVPEGPIDIPPMQAFPMDSDLDIMGGLDFRKGCYIGQELTVRTYHTGILTYIKADVYLTRPYRPPENVASNPSAPLYPSGLDIRTVALHEEYKNSPRPRSSGKLLTSLQGVGLALLRLEHVEAVMKGNMQLQFVDKEKTWAVTPRWPSWWPRQPGRSE